VNAGANQATVSTFLRHRSSRTTKKSYDARDAEEPADRSTDRSKKAWAAPQPLDELSLAAPCSSDAPEHRAPPATETPRARDSRIPWKELLLRAPISALTIAGIRIFRITLREL
jgi:hypothetical protein